MLLAADAIILARPTMFLNTDMGSGRSWETWLKIIESSTLLFKLEMLSILATVVWRKMLSVKMESRQNVSLNRRGADFILF